MQNSQDSAAFFAIGKTLSKLKQYEQVIVALTRVTERNRNALESQDAFFLIATAHKKLGRYDKALENYTKAIKLGLNSAQI